MDDINEVKESIIDAAAKWKSIGDALEVGSGELEKIEKDYHKSDDRLRETISVWLKGNGGTRTWKFLCKALRTKSVSEPDLAKKIEEKRL